MLMYVKCRWLDYTLHSPRVQTRKFDIEYFRLSISIPTPNLLCQQSSPHTIWRRKGRIHHRFHAGNEFVTRHAVRLRSVCNSVYSRPIFFPSIIMAPWSSLNFPSFCTVFVWGRRRRFSGYHRRWDRRFRYFDLETNYFFDSSGPWAH